MYATIQKWGNSQGIRIPRECMLGTGIDINELLNISVSDGVITLTKTFRHRTLAERAADYGGNLNLDGEYDWGESVGREVW